MTSPWWWAWVMFRFLMTFVFVSVVFGSVWRFLERSFPRMR